MLFHSLDTNILPPERFNNPFYYDVHPLCAMAVEDIKKYISSLSPNEGKMFGVLVVRDKTGHIGYLAAYSGQIENAISNTSETAVNDIFVPAVFDYLQPDGYFKIKEKEISLMNKEISDIVSSNEYQKAIANYNEIKKEAETEIAKRQKAMKNAKTIRDQRRKNENIPEDEELNMT